jgi:hypothetical protein
LSLKISFFGYIEKLNLGVFFNLPLDNLPSSIKSIKFDKESQYNKPLSNLPSLLEILELPCGYEIPIKNINSECKIIKKSKNQIGNKIDLLFDFFF